MKKQLLKIAIILCLVVVMLATFKIPVQALSGPTIEIGEVRSLSNEVQVPIKLYETTYLSSLSFSISVPENSGVTIRKFEPVGIFASEQFSSKFDQSSNTLKIDFLSLTEKEITLSKQTTTVGVITFSVSSKLEEGESVEITVDQIIAKGKGKDILFDKLHGKIEKRLPIGGVESGTGPTVASALRILQHVNGTNPITEREMFLSADVDGNGIVNQDDAQQILDYITGLRTSFLAVETTKLPNAVVGSDYYQVITAKHGREPYEFNSKGTLPSGIKLNKQTGELSGTPKTAKNYTFTIEVTDAVGNTATRIFELNVSDSDIVSVEDIPPINVRLGAQPNLPSEVTVTYKDKSKGREPVTWGTVDTSQYGETFVTGEVGNTGFTITVKINVVNTNYINSVEIGYVQFINFHTIKVNVNPEVYAVTVNGLDMIYEGNNNFSLSSSSLKKGSTIIIKAYDKYGNLLETRTDKIEIN